MKKKYARNQLYIRFIIVTAALVLTVSFLFGNIFVFAKSDQTQMISYKYFTSVKIQSGDTLWDLAQTYYSNEYESLTDYIEDVKKINSLTSDSIHAGKYLMIPYYSEHVK